MAIQSVGNFGTGSPLPAAPPQGNAGSVPSPVAQSEAPLQGSPRQPAPDRAQLEQAVKEIRQLVKPMVSNSLDFSIDDSTGKTIVRITDSETGEMIRQIPSEEMMDIARSVDRMQGLLLRQKA
ncbi:MAG: flagellar protein FlaG [Sulfuritalea sp.]|nr:flagellar protein FlaG [Sulfuritalea sp.]